MSKSRPAPLDYPGDYVARQSLGMPPEQYFADVDAIHSIFGDVRRGDARWREVSLDSRVGWHRLASLARTPWWWCWLGGERAQRSPYSGGSALRHGNAAAFAEPSAQIVTHMYTFRLGMWIFTFVTPSDRLCCVVARTRSSDSLACGVGWVCLQ